ncbi:MAG: MMPL family transporter, partial [Deltaproteobacteria bacterium]|nr:MMPL family transporter [Deltaproteobacteria bacterium]
MKKFAEQILKYRLAVLVAVFIPTVIFAFFCTKLSISTDFNALLPQTHPYIKINQEFGKLFGGANQLVMLLEVKDGDLFNQATLQKVKDISNQLRKLKGIDRFKILSIAESKMMDFKVTSYGFTSEPLMWPNIPKTDADMEKLKNAIWASPQYYGGLVSLDLKKTLILASFLEEKLDYEVIYNDLNKIRSAAEDKNHILSIVGYPMHIGTIGHLVDKVNLVLLGTVLLIPVLLFLAYRSLWATIMVPATGVISAIWGLGFMGMLGLNLDPLVFVLPFLISLMAFRHSHQLYNRFYEEYSQHGDRMKGARTLIEHMFLPGLTSVITDAMGIAIIAIVPIPVLQNIAIACAFWSVITVIVGLILTPILLTYAPVSERAVKRMAQEREKEKNRTGYDNRFGNWLGPWLITGKGKGLVLAIVCCMLVFSWYWSERLIVGDAHVGSNLLYPSSRYNQDSERINKSHPLINPLSIIVSGEKKFALNSVDVLMDIYSFSRHMFRTSGAVSGETIVLPILGLTKANHGNDPRWYGFPDTDKETLKIFEWLKSAGAPGDTDRYIDYNDQYTNIVMYYKDKTGPTIQKAIASAKEFIEKQSKLDKNGNVKYQLAGGVIGVEAAINETVAQKQLQTLLLALASVFLFCTIQFRSWKAGLILTIPVILSNFMAFAYMAINGIGLSISTLPVSSAGIGMGVDYGIYLLARMYEEKKMGASVTLEEALIRTVQTYGKSIFYIAGTLILGLLVWALSPLKFQSEMGVMLAVILFFNCLGAIFLVPVLALLFKPKFLL